MIYLLAFLWFCLGAAIDLWFCWKVFGYKFPTITMVLMGVLGPFALLPVLLTAGMWRIGR